ncbi:MAG: heme o synthase [Gemmatimonadota bacterium]|nr:heme o synthase [Gemmatimonadota bacterium]
MATVAAGFYMAEPLSSAASWLVLVHAMIGSAFVAGGTNALNQVAERDLDALMRRTSNRPLPSGRLSFLEAASFAWFGGVAGIAYLAVFVNVTTAVIAVATLVSYVFVYTPLKTRTPLATLVGAVPGALPILGGWTAAGVGIDARAMVLFGIMFLWQIPHFLALAWMYREDYARAGMRMLSVDDDEGRSTFGQAFVNTVALLPISLVPTVLGMSGAIYFFGALLLSGWFIWASWVAARQRTVAGARKLFLASLIYLPALLLLMAVDRLA